MHSEDRDRGSGGPSHTGVAAVSLAVSVVLLAVKFTAYAWTGSQAIFSDALESIVNVVAAGFAIGVVAYAGRPADRDHPFGHGKLEFFSAAFEGGLIFCAALVILWRAIVAFAQEHAPERLDLGLVLIGAAGAVNGVLGWFLLRHGRRHHSAAIEADGAHVLTDFWTSVGVVVGLVAVWLTGLWWFDPLVAAIMGAMLLVTGWRLVRRSGGALLDEEDPAFLRQLVAVLGPHVRDGIIRVHRMRAIRAGRFRHVSAHLVVPEFWTVEQAHDAAATLSASVVRELGTEAELEFHTDPCERAYCATCDLEACSVRAQPFQRLEPLTVDEAVAPEGKAHGR